MRKLGSSPISCEDFSIPGGITNRVSVYQPPKGQGEARLNYCSITIILSVTHIYIYMFPHSFLTKWSMDINGGCSTLAGWCMNIPSFGIAVLPMGFISGSMKWTISVSWVLSYPFTHLLFMWKTYTNQQENDVSRDGSSVLALANKLNFDMFWHMPMYYK